MNLQKLKEAIHGYKLFLRSHPDHDPYWKWESQRIFQDNWDIDTKDFHSMFDSSLQNSRTRRLWNRENYAPKHMMMKFINTSEDYVRFAFMDLFNENKDIEGRVDRFVFYCDELYGNIKRNIRSPQIIAIITMIIMRSFAFILLFVIPISTLLIILVVSSNLCFCSAAWTYLK